jgi:hypothetical protein
VIPAGPAPTTMASKRSSSMFDSFVQPVPGKFSNFIEIALDGHRPTAKSQQPIARSPSPFTPAPLYFSLLSRGNGTSLNPRRSVDFRQV